jgi:hypothetical protein
MIERHGKPKPGHVHNFRYTDHGSFSSWSKCECGAQHVRNYSPDGYIGDKPDEVIYELGCCFFVAGWKCDDAVLEGVT